MSDQIKTCSNVFSRVINHFFTKPSYIVANGVWSKLDRRDLPNKLLGSTKEIK